MPQSTGISAFIVPPEPPPAVVTAMPENACLVQWTGRQAVVTFPEHIGTSNAGHVREQLLWVINRGAAVLIADLTGTVSCDHSGVDAMARAYHRAVANGTQLRMVVTADVVRRLLSLSGLDRLISTYPTLEAAVAAGAGRPETPDGPGTAVITTAVPGPAGLGREAAADPADMLDWVVSSIFNVSIALQAAIGLPPDITEQRVIDALGRLDDAVQEIRRHVFAGHGQQLQPGLTGGGLQDAREHSARARDRTVLLHQRVMHTAHALHWAAADTATLLEQRADLLGQPGRIDYPTQIKRWRVLADQAQQMAECWEQQP